MIADGSGGLLLADLSPAAVADWSDGLDTSTRTLPATCSMTYSMSERSASARRAVSLPMTSAGCNGRPVDCSITAPDSAAAGDPAGGSGRDRRDQRGRLRPDGFAGLDLVVGVFVRWLYDVLAGYA